MGHRCPIVQVVKVPGYRFLTIGEDHPIWTATDGLLNSITIPLSDVRFVRLRPPADATDKRIEDVRLGLTATGAIDVQVLKRTRAQVVLDQASVSVFSRTGDPVIDAKGIRETVEEMVQESNTKDRQALERVVQEILVGVGL